MKKFIIAMLVGCLVGVVYSASVQTITIPAQSLSSTWVNTIGPKRAVELKSAFIQYTSAPTLDSPVAAKVSKGGVTYTVDTVTTTSNGLTYAIVDFGDTVWCDNAQTVTVSRTATTTGQVVNVMLVVE